MHRALEISTIPHEIFTFLGTVDNDPNDFVDLCALANAAASCQTFSYPALDVLWKVMDSIEPLFSILPTFQKETHTLNGPITPSNWARFQQYARRIRVLSCEDTSDINHSTFIQVSQLLKGEPLLPCLGVLDRRFEYWENLLITPTLHEVVLTTSKSLEERDALGVFLHGLIAVAPKLRCLDLTAGALSQSHIQTISQLMSLHKFSLMFNSPDVHVLREISTLQNITKLTLDFGSRRIRVPSGSTGLGCLRLLEIRAHLALVGDFIDLVSSDDLKSLHITHAWPQSIKPEEVNVIGGMWCGPLRRASRWSQSLFKLELSDDLPTMEGLNVEKPKLVVIDELLPFAKLQLLVLNFEFVKLQLVDEDFRRMATAWPEMHMLNIPGKTPSFWLSIAVLETVALHWPSVRHIAIPLDLCTLPPEPRYIESHPLEILSLDSVRYTDPVLVARNLDSLFPSLQISHTPTRRTQIQVTLNAFHSVRKDEVRRLERLIQ